MRRTHSFFASVFIVATLAGCKNPSVPLTNPFLTPDRVPPPSTRVLTPGTAQPYYPGDPAPGATYPGATAVPPAGAYTPGIAPPAGAYPSGPAYPINPVTPTAPVVPPGGWNTYPSQASAFTPNAGSPPPIQQAAFDEAPPTGQPGPQRLQIREVTPAEYLSQQPAASTAVASRPSQDGFRPQGSEPRVETPTESPVVKGFRSPSLAKESVVASNADQRFGVGASQEWLRGQLEFWPETGEWSIRYMGDGPVDQIGGRVLIDNPQVLGNLPPGEFVVIQGQLYGRQIDEASYRPAYRVAAVQRQRQ